MSSSFRKYILIHCLIASATHFIDEQNEAQRELHTVYSLKVARTRLGFGLRSLTSKAQFW